MDGARECAGAQFGGVQGGLSGKRRDAGAFNAVPLQSITDKATGLHLFDKLRQDAMCRRAAALGQAHGLLDDHEAPWQQPQARKARHVGFELLLYASGDLEVLFSEQVNDGW